MKASVQWCGMVGATARRICSRSNFQPFKVSRIAATVVSPGASLRRATSFWSAGDSASISPGIASYMVSSATIGATTARSPASA